MVGTSEQIEKNRKQASRASLGLSGKPIYTRGVELFKQFVSEGKVLDYGAGQGRLLAVLSGLGKNYEFCGADLMNRPGDLADSIKWIEWDLNNSLPNPDAEYGGIISLEVIEHLENPRFIAREWYRLLAPGGTLIMSTPNNESYRSLLSYSLRGHFTDFTKSSYPAHIVALNRLDIKRIMLEAGFKYIEFYYSNHGCLPKFTKVSWQVLSLGLLKGLRFSDNIFAVVKK